MRDEEIICQECGRELEEIDSGQEEIGEEDDRTDYILRRRGSCLSCGTINLRESYFSLYGNYERQVKEEDSEYAVQES